MTWTKKKLQKFAEEYCCIEVPLDKIERTSRNARYLLHCYWGSGSHICGVTEKQAIETIDDMMSRGYDDAYDIELYDLNDKGQLMQWDVQTQITLKPV